MDADIAGPAEVSLEHFTRMIDPGDSLGQQFLHIVDGDVAFVESKGGEQVHPEVNVGVGLPSKLVESRLGPVEETRHRLLVGTCAVTGGVCHCSSP